MSQLITKFIADDAITQDKITDDAVGTAQIADGAVDTDRLGADAVTGAKIGDDQIDSEHIAAASIDHEHLADDIITGATAETTVNGSDEVLIYDQSATALRRMTVTNLGLGAGSLTMLQEVHKITAGDVSAGYFTLSQSPVNAGHVTAFAYGGIPQVNKQVVGATGATPDFDILSTNQFHFNNTVATGLSEILVADDIVFIQYAY